jgi:hypothetical protein
VIWLDVFRTAVILVAAQAILVAIAAALLPGRNIYKILIGIAFLTAPAVFAAGEWITGGPLTPGGRSFLTLLHLGLGGLFFHFMTLPDRSVTLRNLVELLQSPGGALTLADLNARYSIRDMIGSRLQQLEDGDFLKIDAAGRLTLLPRGVTFGRFVTGGRKLFRIGSAN